MGNKTNTKYPIVALSLMSHFIDQVGIIYLHMEGARK